MQLGELQHQHERFVQRGVTVLALSVDEPEASLALIQRLGIRFPIGSDPEQEVIQAFRVQNPDTRALAIHAVYIVDSHSRIFYRKVGLRRPLSQELIDAIDAFRGEYPRTDEIVEPRQRINVAYPQNEFQALLTASSVEALPSGIDPTAFESVLMLIHDRQSDDALVAYRTLLGKSQDASEQALLDSAAWLTRMRFFSDLPDAIETGKLLSWRLGRIRELEQALTTVTDDDELDALRQTLARARAGLQMTRAEIELKSESWNLRRAKTTLRSYLEVARAELRVRDKH